MQITIYIYHTGAPDDPSKLTDTLVDRIEYAGQQIFLENGKIRVETVEEPEPVFCTCHPYDRVYYGCRCKKQARRETKEV